MRVTTRVARSRTGPFKKIFLVAAVVLVVVFCWAPAASAAPKRTIILVVDVSGSMDSGGRLVQAQDALQSTIGALDKNDVVGLHTFAGFSCDDGGQLLVPPGTGNRDELRSEVDALTASGETPTPAAIRQAVSEFPDDSSEKVLMLVSDGESSCGDPCPVVTEVQQESGIDFVAHTVGFQTDDDAEEQLSCIADRTGGKYFAAEDEKAIVDSLKEALITPVNDDVSTVLHSLPSPSDVPLDAKSVSISAALGAAFVLLIGFPSELFNRTLEANQKRISRSFRRRGGPGAGPAGGGGPAPGGGGGPFPPDGSGGGPGDPGGAPGGAGESAAYGHHAQHGPPGQYGHAGASPTGPPGLDGAAGGGGPGDLGGLGLHSDSASAQGGVAGSGGAATAGGTGGYGATGGAAPGATGGFAGATGGFAGATGGAGVPGAFGGAGAVGATGGAGTVGATGGVGGIGAAGTADGTRSLWASPWILPIFVVLSAIASTFVDPDSGFNTQSGILLLGFVVAVPLVLFSYAWPNEQVARRASHVPAALRTVPAALGLAIFCTVLSRISEFVPGYVFGLVLGYVALRERRLTRAQEGKGVLLGALTALVVSVAAWVGLEFVHDKAIEPGANVGLTIADTVLGTTFILGVETVIFGLVPLRMLDGNKLRKWNAWIWAGTYAVAILLFVHVLLLNSDAAGSDNDTSVTAAVVLFAVFGLVSLGFWAYFKYIPDPALLPPRPVLAGGPPGYPPPPAPPMPMPMPPQGMPLPPRPASAPPDLPPPPPPPHQPYVPPPARPPVPPVPATPPPPTIAPPNSPPPPTGSPEQQP